MKKCDLLGISIGSDPDIAVVSTDENAVKWITEQIQKLSPTGKIRNDQSPAYELSKLSETKNHSVVFFKMDYKQHAVGLWLIKELCHNGWEPFGDVNFSSVFGFSKITLRKYLDS